MDKEMININAKLLKEPGIWNFHKRWFHSCIWLFQQTNETWKDI